MNIDLNLYGLFTVWDWSLYCFVINMINISESRNGMDPAPFVDDKFVTNIGRLMWLARRTLKAHFTLHSESYNWR